MANDRSLSDRATTLRNRERLGRNTNLLYWYERLYRDQFWTFVRPDELTVLEIGSGVSPLSRFHPRVLTSDVMELDYLDYVFDAHQIDQLTALKDESVDIITLTNVLHHLEKPLEFLRRATIKLKPGGKIIATEPYFSLLSTWVFKNLHHESVDCSITQPQLTDLRGPVTSANIALPWLIFFRNDSWREQVLRYYQIDSIQFFTALSYMMTGGISRRIPIPSLIYRLVFPLDLLCSRLAPGLCASFFTVILRRK